MKNKKGFTLAEVLVTLAIIGVVAALTIPALIQKTQNDAAVSELKKIYSSLFQVFNSFEANGTSIEKIFAEAGGDDAAALNQFCSKLNCIKNCGTNTGCFPDSEYKLLNGSDELNYNEAGYATAILTDGSLLVLQTVDQNCNGDYSVPSNPSNPLYHTCASIRVDINGFKEPNQFGRDFFAFWVTKTGIIPWGSSDDGNNDCSDITTDLGYACAGRVLTEGAVNY